jgi:G-protein alpha subunit
MRESLALFDEVCNSELFVNTPMILLLNKEDVFREKIERVHLNVCFEDYAGPMKYEESLSFIRDKFTAINRNPNKTIPTHVTCAVDTSNIEVVFNAVKDFVLRNLLAPLF